MEINNKVGWLLIAIVAVIVGAVVWKRSIPVPPGKPPELPKRGEDAGEGQSPEKDANSPDGSATSKPNRRVPGTPGTAGVYIYFPS